MQWKGRRDAAAFVRFSIVRKAKGTFRCPTRARFIGKQSPAEVFSEVFDLTKTGSQHSENLTRLRSRDHAGEILLFLTLGC
jgi:hypothetical protein